MPTTFADSDWSPLVADTPPLPPAAVPAPGTSTGSAQGIGRTYAEGVTIQGALWRIIITTLETETLTLLDSRCRNRSILAQLNQPWVISGEVDSDDPEIWLPYDGDDLPLLAEGVRLAYAFRREAGGDPKWRIRAAGPLLTVTDAAEADVATTSWSAFSPWQYLYRRPVLDDLDGEPTGEFLPTLGKTYFAQPGALIALQVLYNSYFLMEQDLNGIAFIDLPVEYGGTGQWAGVIETTEELQEWTIEQGKSVGEAWDDLVGSGTMDIVLDPVYDPINRPGVCADLSIFTRKGVARDDAILAWDKPSRNMAGINRLIDGNLRSNYVKFHAGQGGIVEGTAQDAASIALFKEYVTQQFFPDKTRQDMVEKMAEQILRLQANGEITIAGTMTPENSPSPLLEYEPGDTMPVYASKNLRQTIGEYLRVQSIPIDIDDEGVETVRNILFSRELEGIS